jgi:very-short-patch-repair endonuclease
VRVNGIWQERINEEEAKAVAAAAASFMRQHSELSLGIVAMNQPQRDLIRTEIDTLVANDSRLSQYLETWEEALEDPFVKNLENVQGDERDVIFISLGWGRTRQGALHQRFYPINRRDDGHRRLNVLFTRAKRKIVVFSSLQPDEILVSETSAPGVRVLRDYLSYARDGLIDRGSVEQDEADSPFETSVANALRALGHNVVLQVGVAGYRIDLAVTHPEEPNRFVLGIECDGATYHSAKSARDRDRLRQEALERLGWRLSRVWSTDWFRDPKGQAERLSREIRAALSQLPAGNRPKQRMVEEDQDLASPPRRREVRVAPTRPTSKSTSKVPSGTPRPDLPFRGSAPTRAVDPPLRDALMVFRDDVIMRDYPGSEPGRCILREEMIELIIRTGLDDPQDFHAKIPEFHRSRTDGRQVPYLEKICDLVARYTERHVSS